MTFSSQTNTSTIIMPFRRTVSWFIAVCSYGKSAGAGSMAGSAAVVVKLSLWSVTYVRPVEAVVASGEYMAFSGRRGDADPLSAVCDLGVWTWQLPRRFGGLHGTASIPW